jgi:hypothetical protein
MNDNMKATLETQNPDNGYNYGGEKETVNAYSLIAQDKQGMREAIVLRTYMGRSRSAQRVYASVWAFGPFGSGIYTAGHGRDHGGGGYHKASAAAHEAIRSAGFNLSHPIDGRGTSAMEDAMRAMARAMGWSGDFLIVRH